MCSLTAAAPWAGARWDLGPASMEGLPLLTETACEQVRLLVLLAVALEEVQQEAFSVGRLQACSEALGVVGTGIVAVAGAGAAGIAGIVGIVGIVGTGPGSRAADTVAGRNRRSRSSGSL